MLELGLEPAERHTRHHALRSAHTVYLTDNAENVEDWAISRMAARLEALQEYPKLLDVGCGNGQYLAKITGSGVGVDIDFRALQRAKADCNLFRLVQGSVLNLPFADKSFDVAMCNRMLNQTRNIALALSEAARVLKPGGMLFVVTADTGMVSPLRAFHDENLERLHFPPHLYTHTTLPNQRFNGSNGMAWLSKDFEDVQIETYERRLTFDNLADLQEYYATGLLFQKSAGLAEPNVRPAQWQALYQRVSGEMAFLFQAGDGLVTFSEGVALFCACKSNHQ